MITLADEKNHIFLTKKQKNKKTKKTKKTCESHYHISLISISRKTCGP